MEHIVIIIYVCVLVTTNVYSKPISDIKKTDTSESNLLRNGVNRSKRQSLSVQDIIKRLNDYASSRGTGNANLRFGRSSDNEPVKRKTSHYQLTDDVWQQIERLNEEGLTNGVGSTNYRWGRSLRNVRTKRQVSPPTSYQLTPTDLEQIERINQWAQLNGIGGFPSTRWGRSVDDRRQKRQSISLQNKDLNKFTSQLQQFKRAVFLSDSDLKLIEQYNKYAEKNGSGDPTYRWGVGKRSVASPQKLNTNQNRTKTDESVTNEWLKESTQLQGQRHFL